MFFGWDGFIDKLTQMFRDLEAEIIAKQKILELIQKGLAMEYMI